MKLTLGEALSDAKKAVGSFLVLEAAAVAAGLIDDAQAGVITGIAGVVSTAIVFIAKNTEHWKNKRL